MVVGVVGGAAVVLMVVVGDVTGVVVCVLVASVVVVLATGVVLMVVVGDVTGVVVCVSVCVVVGVPPGATRSTRLKLNVRNSFAHSVSSCFVPREERPRHFFTLRSFLSSK